jgi:hypothetical protein
LRDGCRAPDCAEQQDLDLKVSALGPDFEEIPNVDLAGRLGRLLVGLNPAEFASARSQSASLEESRCPKPFVDPNGIHASYFLSTRAIVSSRESGDRVIKTSKIAAIAVIGKPARFR